MIEISNNANKQRIQSIERLVLDLMPIGVMLTTVEGVPRYMNSVANKIIVKSEDGLFLTALLFTQQEKEDLKRSTAGKIVEINNSKILLVRRIFQEEEAQWLFLMLEIELFDDLANELKMAEDLNCELEALFASSFDELFVTDGDGKTLRVNGACERHYGLKAEEMVGRNVKELEEKGVFTPSATLMAIKSRQRVTMLQSTVCSRQLIATANPVFDENNNIVRVVSNTRDVTELLQLGKQLEKALVQVSLYRTELAELRSSNLNTNLVAHSHEMEKVLSLARKVAPVDTTVLLLGETGSGKNAIAKFIHRASIRCKGPFIEIDCGAIPQNLLESELFGYVAGAFTMKKQNSSN